MSTIREITTNPSVLLVESLLQKHFAGDSTISIMQNNMSAESLPPGFDAKGSTRVEVLYDIVAKGGDCEVINLHGLAEDCEEKQVPMVFFCEMVWLDTEKKMRDIDSTEQLPSSFVIDPVEKPSIFHNTVFSVTFENKQNGKIIGRGEGYLRFEKGQQ